MPGESKKYSAHSKDLLSHKNAADTFYCLYTHLSTALLPYKSECVTEKRRGVKTGLFCFLF